MTHRLRLPIAVVLGLAVVPLLACPKDEADQGADTNQSTETTEGVGVSAETEAVMDTEPMMDTGTTDMTTEPMPTDTTTEAGTSGSPFGPHDSGLDGTRLTYYQAPDEARCETDCAGRAECQGWTFIRRGYYKPTDPSMCYLMSRVTQWQPSACCISAVKPESGLRWPGT